MLVYDEKMKESKSRYEELQSEIEASEKRIAELRSEITEQTERLAALRQELSTLAPGQLAIPLSSAFPQTLPVPATNAEKVILFRSLFRGREDVFPRRWDNPKTGRSGYSPACANEWDLDLCEKKKGATGGRKPRATCSECANQAFLPVTDEEIANHLRGEQIMGVYPLLPDETCRFLAADFDKKSWQEDVHAFAETCKTRDVPVAIERSRSGNGAHAWIFFSAPILAAAARKMACFLITETMARRHQLSMESYDRLFPNQDTMPKGGFGNLIAMPLQRQARDSGNSVFVDDNFIEFPDQWSFLANLRRLDPSSVQTLAEEAVRRGQVIGVRLSDPLSDEERSPWNRTPSKKPKKIAIEEPIPSNINAVIAQRLFIEKKGLPSALINRIKRAAAFQNPEFYKRQSLRFSTALTPRVIACFKELPEHISLPRGCLSNIEALLNEHGASLNIEDLRQSGTPFESSFQGTLTPIQEEAVKNLLAHDTGVFVAPPGIGKTVVGTYLVAARCCSTLILVHRKPLLEQWIAQLALFLGKDTKAIGRIGTGVKKPNGHLDVAMLQSLVRKGEVEDIVAGYGQVIIDECHHAPAVSFERVLSEVKARFIAGLTATPYRRDGLHPIIGMQIGPVRFTVDSRCPSTRCPFDYKLLVRETNFKPVALAEDAGIQNLYAALAADSRRNGMIFDDVIRALEDKRSPILLTERRDHLEWFAERLRKFTRNLVVLHGGMKTRERRQSLEQLAAIPDGEERLLLATGRYIGEGFDDARLDTLFLALPVSWKGTLVQYAGRLHRLHPGKVEVRIYDYVDRDVPVALKMFERRLRGYRAIGYTCEDAPADSNPFETELIFDDEQGYSGGIESEKD